MRETLRDHPAGAGQQQKLGVAALVVAGRGGRDLVERQGVLDLGQRPPGRGGLGRASAQAGRHALEDEVVLLEKGGALGCRLELGQVSVHLLVDRPANGAARAAVAGLVEQLHVLQAVAGAGAVFARNLQLDDVIDLKARARHLAGLGPGGDLQQRLQLLEALGLGLLVGADGQLELGASVGRHVGQAARAQALANLGFVDLDALVPLVSLVRAATVVAALALQVARQLALVVGQVPGLGAWYLQLAQLGQLAGRIAAGLLLEVGRHVGIELARQHGPGILLLHHMRQLMRQQRQPGRVAGLVTASGKKDVAAGSESQRAK